MTSQTYWSDLYHGNAMGAVSGDVVLKAGEGASFTDPTFHDRVLAIVRAGFDARGYYALHRGTTQEMQAQAHRAFALIGTRGAMFDVEKWPAEAGSPAGIASLNMVCAAVDYYQAMPGARMNVIYLPRSQWEAMGSPDLTPLVRRGLHLVNANYDHGSEDTSNPAWYSYGGMQVWAVQYQACHNTARGTQAQARAVWDAPKAATPPPAAKPDIYTVQHGDTFDGIAAAHHLTPPALKALNPKAGHPTGNVNLIYSGDKLVISK